MSGRWARLALGFVVALALAEGATRLLAPYLPEPRLFTDDTTQLKVRQLDAAADRAGCIPVVAVGNSMTRDAVVPARLSQALPGRPDSYNAALDAATPELLDGWIQDHVLSRVDVGHVVLGLSSFDLNDESRIAASALSSYRAAPLTRDDVLGRLQRPFVEHLALFRHRAELRRPGLVRDGLERIGRSDEEGRITAEGIDGVIGPDGEGRSRRSLRYDGSPAATQFARSELLNDFTVGGAQVTALGGVVEGLVDRGVGVTVVMLPVTDDYVALHPDGDDDLEAAVDLARSTSEDHGAGFVDLHDWARGDEDFADTHHLNGPAADRFSADLASHLPAGAGRSCGP